MKPAVGTKIRIIRKNIEDSPDYQLGDVFTVEGTWYGGVHVTTGLGLPLSLDEGEYEPYEEEKRPVDPYSYELGVMDCFCEMVASGLKRLAMSHPNRDKEDWRSYEPAVRELCGKYGILYYGEEEPLITDLFPASMNEGTCHYLFYREPEVLKEYLAVKADKKEAIAAGAYDLLKRDEIARRLGRLLSYPEEGIRRYIERTRAGK